MELAHPSPGKSYPATTLIGGLPCTVGGIQLTELLTLAFRAGVLVTVGANGTLKWNGVSLSEDIRLVKHFVVTIFYLKNSPQKYCREVNQLFFMLTGNIAGLTMHT